MMNHRYLSEARYVASRIVTALKDCKRNPVFRDFIITERGDAPQVRLEVALERRGLELCGLGGQYNREFHR